MSNITPDVLDNVFTDCNRRKEQSVKEQHFTEKDLHCIARLIQSSFLAPEQESIENTYRPLYGCMYCKYTSECYAPGITRLQFRKLFDKLEGLTKVSIGTYAPDTKLLGDFFLPASYYLEHPETIYALEKVHSHDTVEEVKKVLDKLIIHSKDDSGQKRDNI